MIYEEGDSVKGRTAFSMMKNTSGASIAKGKVVSILETQTAGDVEIKPAAAVIDGSTMVGVTAEIIADDQFGKVQSYGIISMAVNGTVAIAVGDSLKVNASGELIKSAAGTGIPAQITALAVAAANPTTINVFLRLA